MCFVMKMLCVSVAILIVVFCVICNLLMFVSAVSGSVLEYGSRYGFVCDEYRFLWFSPCY